MNKIISKSLIILLVIIASCLVTAVCTADSSSLSTTDTSLKGLASSNETNGIYESDENAPELFWTVSRLTGSLLLIIALIYLSIYVLGKLQKKGGLVNGQKRYLQIIEKLYLSPKKAIFLVKVPGKALLLSVGHNEISMLSEIDEEYVKESISKNTAFSEQLKSFTGTGDRDNKN